MRRSERGTVEVDGLRIAYESAGSGPALVLVHGYVGDGRRTWWPQLKGLSDAFTVVAWDAPGSGGSSDPRESFRMPDYADCLAGFIGTLGLRRPCVIGLSFGGAVALELFRRHPSIPRSLILASAYAGWAGSLPPDVVGQRLRQAEALADLPADELVRAVVPTLFSAESPAAMIDEFGESMYEFHPAGLRAMARSVAEADLRDVLPLVDVPTLLLYGEDDVRAPVSVAEDIHAAIAGSKLVVLPGVGHLISLEAAERFNAEVREFMSSTRD